jgi:V8-like Glu-specific endopeptidase
VNRLAGRLRAVTALLATAIVVAVTVLAGCTEARPDVVRTLGPVGAAYWNRARLLGALPLGGGVRAKPTPGATAKSHAVPTGAGLRVGALFEHSDSGNHYCTASVVDSPGQDLLITAAHCIYNGGSYDRDIVFIPDYRNGKEPYGVWTVARLLVPSQWQESANPDYDFGFVVLNSHSGMNIEQILGANQLGADTGYQYLVHVTGYPDGTDAPISCVNYTSEQSSTQLRFECSGYTGGTSGSPWVTHFSSASRTGTIVGVIGGYEEGGDTPSVSYSVRFGAPVQHLYQQAISLPTVPATGPSPSPASS